MTSYFLILARNFSVNVKVHKSNYKTVMKTFSATFRDTIDKYFGKNRAKLFSNFTRHHLITHTPFLRVLISLVPIALRSIYLSGYRSTQILQTRSRSKFKARLSPKFFLCIIRSR